MLITPRKWPVPFAGNGLRRDYQGGSNKMKKTPSGRQPPPQRPRTVGGQLFWVQPLGRDRPAEEASGSGARRLAAALFAERIAVHPQAQAEVTPP